MTDVPFDVTPISPRVDVRVGKTATATFTVKNRVPSGTSVILTAHVGSGDTPWITVRAPTDRRFNVEGTEQVIVDISPPDGTPASEIQVRLRVARTDSVQEEFAESPVVTITIQAAVEEQVRRFPWWIVAVATSVVVVTGIVVFVVTRPPGLRSECTEKCADGLECSDSHLCLRVTGATCKEASECISAYCSEKMVCSAEPEVSPPALGEKCSEGVCAEGLACFTGLCRGPDEYVGCHRADDCVSLNCRTGGICGLPTFKEACTAEKRCAEKLSCSGNVCVGANGFVGCASPDGCVSGYCGPGGVCGQPGLLDECTGQCSGQFTCVKNRCRAPNNYAGCSEDAQCSSGFCSAKTNKCGAPGLGESCAEVNCSGGLFCDTDKRCRGNDGYRTCTENADCRNGHCRLGKCDSGALWEPCSDDAPCASTLECAEYNVTRTKAGPGRVAIDPVVATGVIVLATTRNLLESRVCLARNGASCLTDFDCESFNCDRTCRTEAGRACLLQSNCSGSDRCTIFNRCVTALPPRAIQTNFPSWRKMYKN